MAAGEAGGAAPTRGWAAVLSFAAVAGASQLLWLTYAPVTTAAAHHYGVSVTAIGWLANVFPLSCSPCPLGWRLTTGRGPLWPRVRC